MKNTLELFELGFIDIIDYNGHYQTGVTFYYCKN